MTMSGTTQVCRASPAGSFGDNEGARGQTEVCRLPSHSINCLALKPLRFRC